MQFPFVHEHQRFLDSSVVFTYSHLRNPSTNKSASRITIAFKNQSRNLTYFHFLDHSDCFEALGMEINAISDVQITGSTEVNSNYAPPLGRLHLLPAVGGLCGAWAAAGGDTNPWLQIDLIKQNTKVNGIATQGRHDVSHWVTKYSLLYSNDSLAWLYYKEQGVKKVGQIRLLIRTLRKKVN